MPEIVSRQAFDEAIFAIPFFRVHDPGAERLEEAWRAVVAAHPRLMGDARTGVEQIALHRRLDALGFHRVCTQVTFVLDPIPACDPVPGVSVQPELALSPAALEAHGRNFTFSRFAQDPRVPRADADRWVQTWIHNSVRGRRRVVALQTDFVTFSGEPGEAIVVDLVSVVDHRRGRGRRLMQHLIAHAAASGAPRIEVTTEGENIPAQRLYTSLGFRPTSARACHHFRSPA